MHFIGGRVKGEQLRIGVQMTTGANLVEAAVFKGGFCVCYCSFFFFQLVENLYIERSDHKHRINFNTMA